MVTMKTYEHNGEQLPDELLDRIADDVRLFDKQQSPETRIVKALEKLADRALRIKIDVAAFERKAERITVAHELAAAVALGADIDDVMQLADAQRLFMRLGLPLPPAGAPESPSDG
jgi:hypothetical protein